MECKTQFGTLDESISAWSTYVNQLNELNDSCNNVSPEGFVKHCDSWILDLTTLSRVVFPMYSKELQLGNEFSHSRFRGGIHAANLPNRVKILVEDMRTVTNAWSKKQAATLASSSAQASAHRGNGKGGFVTLQKAAAAGRLPEYVNLMEVNSAYTGPTYIPPSSRHHPLPLGQSIVPLNRSQSFPSSTLLNEPSMDVASGPVLGFIESENAQTSWRASSEDDYLGLGFRSQLALPLSAATYSPLNLPVALTGRITSSTAVIPAVPSQTDSAAHDEVDTRYSASSARPSDPSPWMNNPIGTGVTSPDWLPADSNGSLRPRVTTSSIRPTRPGRAINKDSKSERERD